MFPRFVHRVRVPSHLSANVRVSRNATAACSIAARRSAEMSLRRPRSSCGISPALTVLMTLSISPAACNGVCSRTSRCCSALLPVLLAASRVPGHHEDLPPRIEVEANLVGRFIGVPFGAAMPERTGEIPWRQGVTEKRLHPDDRAMRRLVLVQRPASGEGEKRQVQGLEDMTVEVR